MTPATVHTVCARPSGWLSVMMAQNPGLPLIWNT